MEIEPGGRYVLFVPTPEEAPFDALLRSGDAFREHLESEGAEVTIFHMPPGSPVALLRLLSHEDIARRDGVEEDYLGMSSHVLHGPTEGARDRWQHDRPERP